MHDPSRVRGSGPLEVFAEGFAAELARLGYRRTPATFQLQLTAHASRWLVGEGLGADELTSEVVERFLAERRAAGYTDRVTARAMAPLLGYLRALGVAAAASSRVVVGAVEVLLADYREYLGVERGLTPDTIEGYVLAVRSFLNGRVRDNDELDLAELTAADVVAFVVARCPGQSRGAAKMTVTGLRSLLGFLHLRGIVSGPLAEAVPSTASWRLSGLPRALEPEQPQALLESCDRDTANGRRDYAVLALEPLRVNADRHHLLVVGAVEDRDAPARRQRLGGAPEEVVFELLGRGLLEGGHLHPLRVDARHDVADGAVLAGRVHRLKHDQQGVAVAGPQQLVRGLELLDAARERRLLLLLALLGEVAQARPATPAGVAPVQPGRLARAHDQLLERVLEIGHVARAAFSGASTARRRRRYSRALERLPQTAMVHQLRERFFELS